MGAVGHGKIEGHTRAACDCASAAAAGDTNAHACAPAYLLTQKTWAVGSGCATFYNTCEEKDGNVHMDRDYLNKCFTITATKDITAHTQLRHPYKSLKWRTCFIGLTDEALAGTKHSEQRRLCAHACQ